MKIKIKAITSACATFAFAFTCMMLLTMQSNAASATFDFASNMGGSANDRGNGMSKAADGGFFMVGQAMSTNAPWVSRGGDDAIIAKYSRDGVVDWVKNAGGAGTDNFLDAIGTPDGGCVAVGHTTGSSTSPPWSARGTNTRDALIVKFSADGTVEWSHAVGNADTGGSTGADSFKDIIAFSDGYVVAGSSSYSSAAHTAPWGNSGGGTDAIIVKYRLDGTIVWTNYVGAGSGSTTFSSLTENIDGSIAAVGTTDTGGSVQGHSWGVVGGEDMFLVRFDASGNALLAKNYGGPSPKVSGTSNENLSSTMATADGGNLSVGTSKEATAHWGNRGDVDGIIVKTAADGSIQWAKNYGSSAYDTFRYICPFGNGDFLIVGYSNAACSLWNNNGVADGIILRCDSNGNVIWSKNVGGSGSDTFFGVDVSPSGQIGIIGYSNGANASPKWGNLGVYDMIFYSMSQVDLSLDVTPPAATFGDSTIVATVSGVNSIEPMKWFRVSANDILDYSSSFDSHFADADSDDKGILTDTRVVSPNLVIEQVVDKNAKYWYKTAVIRNGVQVATIVESIVVNNIYTKSNLTTKGVSKSDNSVIVYPSTPVVGDFGVALDLDGTTVLSSTVNGTIEVTGTGAQLIVSPPDFLPAWRNPLPANYTVQMTGIDLGELIFEYEAAPAIPLTGSGDSTAIDRSNGHGSANSSIIRAVAPPLYAESNPSVSPVLDESSNPTTGINDSKLLKFGLIALGIVLLSLIYKRIKWYMRTAKR